MREIQLGETPNTDARDAIHIAIIPMIAPEMLRPGQRVGIKNGKVDITGEAVGIVDPYLKDVVPKDSRFWLCLLPNIVTGMRHHWLHPDFENSVIEDQPMSDSEKWLREYAKKLNIYDGNEEDAFARLVDGLKQKEVFAYGTDLHGLYELDDADDLRYHAEAYLGIRIDWGDFGFSCSC